MEGKLPFKINWASLIVGSKFTIFFVTLYEGNFQVQPPGGLYLEGRFNRGFFALPAWGLIFGGAYTWRGLFSEFYGIVSFNLYHFLEALRGSELGAGRLKALCCRTPPLLRRGGTSQ